MSYALLDNNPPNETLLLPGLSISDAINVSPKYKYAIIVPSSIVISASMITTSKSTLEVSVTTFLISAIGAFFSAVNIIILLNDSPYKAPLPSRKL